LRFCAPPSYQLVGERSARIATEHPSRVLCSGPTPLYLGLGGLGRVSHEQHSIGGCGSRRLIVFAYRADLSPRTLTVVLDANIVVALVLDAKGGSLRGSE
jgi:hypothetical protein